MSPQLAPVVLAGAITAALAALGAYADAGVAAALFAALGVSWVVRR